MNCNIIRAAGQNVCQVWSTTKTQLLLIEYFRFVEVRSWKILFQCLVLLPFNFFWIVQSGGPIKVHQILQGRVKDQKLWGPPGFRTFLVSSLRKVWLAIAVPQNIFGKLWCRWARPLSETMAVIVPPAVLAPKPSSPKRTTTAAPRPVAVGGGSAKAPWTHLTTWKYLKAIKQS